MLVLAVLQIPAAAAELRDLDVRAVEVTADGAVWFGVRGRGLAHFAENRLEWIADFPLDGVADLHQDTHGVLWAAGLGGAAALEGRVWRHVPDPGGLGSRVVFQISEETGERGAMWFAGTGGAARLAGDHWETITDAEGLPHAVVHAVLATESGTRWFACRRGLARMDREGLATFEPTTNFRSILQAPSGTIWFGTSSGVLSWSDEGLTEHDVRGAVFPILVSADGALWSGSDSQGVLRYSRGEWRPVPLPGIPEGVEVFDLAEDARGKIWVASSRGAWLIDPQGAL